MDSQQEELINQSLFLLSRLPATSLTKSLARISSVLPTDDAELLQSMVDVPFFRLPLPRALTDEESNEQEESSAHISPRYLGFLCSQYNQVGDLYRNGSGDSILYNQLGEQQSTTSDLTNIDKTVAVNQGYTNENEQPLRKLEKQLADAMRVYLDLYYPRFSDDLSATSSFVSSSPSFDLDEDITYHKGYNTCTSTYLWSLADPDSSVVPSEISDISDWAGCIGFQNSSRHIHEAPKNSKLWQSGQDAHSVLEWNSSHLFSVHGPNHHRKWQYKLTSTVILQIHSLSQNHSSSPTINTASSCTSHDKLASRVSFSSTLTKQSEVLGTDAFVCTIGKMVESAEKNLRSQLTSVDIGKTNDIVSALRRSPVSDTMIKHDSDAESSQIVRNLGTAGPEVMSELISKLDSSLAQ